MVAYKWIRKEVNEDVVERLHNELKINKSLCKVLVGRGIDDYNAAKKYFRPSKEDLHNPYLMKDMDKAVRRITDAIHRQEKVRIYGDYDVDGTTAVAVVSHFLIKNIQHPSTISYYIPNRYTEGYGISTQGIDDAIENGCTLMIALDCGIKAIDKIDYAVSRGLEVIVCDHHLPDDILPNAFAILNPKQKDCTYPFKELSGCGIGFKLIVALAEAWDIDISLTETHLDLVATSIASDIVPMIGENRVLAYYGLKKANENPSLPIAILKDISGLLHEVNIGRLVFMIGPRINAAGRMNDANKVVEFFLSEDEDVAKAIAKSIHSDNEDRKELDNALTQDAIQFVIDNGLENQKSLVLHNPNWHKGVIGIVASRVIERFYKPTIMLTTTGDVATGSARSVEGFDIHKAISHCEDLLISWGGHQFAAGLTMKKESVWEFAKRFETIVNNTILPESLYPKIIIDAEAEISAITINFLKIIAQMEPCGPYNMAPIFLIKNVKDTGYSRVVKDKHIQFFITQNGRDKIKGIGFNMLQHYDTVRSGKEFDIVCHVEKNEWNGNVSAELRILDMRLSDK